jgi:hypothetical protein
MWETQNDLCAVEFEFMDSVRMSFTLPFFNPRYEMALTSIDCSNMILNCHSDSVISNSSVIQKTRFKIQIFHDSLECVWVARFVATLRGEREHRARFRSSSSWQAARPVFCVCYSLFRLSVLYRGIMLSELYCSILPLFLLMIWILSSD